MLPPHGVWVTEANTRHLVCNVVIVQGDILGSQSHSTERYFNYILTSPRVLVVRNDSAAPKMHQSLTRASIGGGRGGGTRPPTFQGGEDSIGIVPPTFQLRKIARHIA